MEVLTGVAKAVTLAKTGATVASGWFSHDLISNFENGSGVGYSEMITAALTYIGMEANHAKLITDWAIPGLAAISVAMAVRLSPKDLAFVLFNKKNLKDLTPEENTAMVREADELHYNPPEGGLLPPTHRDLDMHFDEEMTRTNGLRGNEKKLDTDNRKKRNMRASTVGGSSTKRMLPHGHIPDPDNDKIALHLPTYGRGKKR